MNRFTVEEIETIRCIISDYLNEHEFASKERELEDSILNKINANCDNHVKEKKR